MHILNGYSSFRWRGWNSWSRPRARSDSGWTGLGPRGEPLTRRAIRSPRRRRRRCSWRPLRRRGCRPSRGSPAAGPPAVELVPRKIGGCQISLGGVSSKPTVTQGAGIPMVQLSLATAETAQSEADARLRFMGQRASPDPYDHCWKEANSVGCRDWQERPATCWEINPATHTRTAICACSCHDRSTRWVVKGRRTT